MIERRKHRRIITLKNFRWLLVLLVLFLAGLSLDISLRGAPAGDFGRLYRKQIKRAEGVKPRPPIVAEAPAVPDHTAADPLLLAPAAREQEFLSTTMTPAEPRPVPIGATVTMETRGSSGVNIVGDPGGVTIVRTGENAKRPLLAGGIFKQP